MDYLGLLLRWLHVGSAVILAGGVIFWRATLWPAMQVLPEPGRNELWEKLRANWSRWVMLTSALLLITGLTNAVLAILRYEFQGPLYHMLVTVKLVLALVLFWIAAVLSGSSPRARRWQTNARFWLSWSVVLALLLVAVGGIMKMTNRTPKAEASVSARPCADAVSRSERT
jgi:uncharacterized membrane protein